MKAWADAQRAERAKAQASRFTNAVPSDLLDYFCLLNPELVRPDWLRPIADLFARAALGEPVRACVSAPPQHGKALADDTWILSVRGWIKVADVVVGDSLVGADGAWTKVLATYPQGEVQLFRVSFTDGVSIETCSEHRWQVHQRYSGRPVLRTTGELSCDLLESDERRKWRVPVVDPLTGEDAALPVDPYLLGCWLGDGSSYRAEITTADDSIRSSFLSEYEPGKRTHQNAGRATTYGFKGLTKPLRLLGLLKNKHVPALYLKATASTRLAVVQGLCDTDGWVAKNGSQQAYCTTSHLLAEDFRFLIASLGGTYTERQRPAAQKTAYEIWFRLPQGMPAFRLERKASRLRCYSARNAPRRFIASIDPTRVHSATCFTVEAKDGLFCAGRDLIVTHNTELFKAGICQFIERNPKKRNLYVSYSATRAEYISNQIRRLLSNRGVVTEGNRGHWETKEGGGLHACGVDGGVTGFPIDGLVSLDDLLKNAKEARSATIRDGKVEDLRQSVLTRAHPGVAAMNVATRWHPRDPSGILTAEGWENVNLTAIAEENDVLGRKIGEALAPKIRPIEFLMQQKRDLTDGPFAAMYQGRPRPRGGTVFHEPNFYTELPREGYAVGFGIDLAYTAKSSADWSICLEMWRVGAPDDPAAKFYIVGVDRAQVEAPSFALTLKARTVRRPGARMLWRASGTERGSAAFLKAQGIPILCAAPPGDKYVSATAVAAAWNDGRVLVPDPEVFPEAKRWLPAFLQSIDDFTGVGDEQDDDVDAAGNAHKLLTSKKGSDTDPDSGSAGAARRSDRTV